MADSGKLTGTITVTGKTLETACWGPSPEETDAPTLVLLHEGLGCVALWRDFPAQLTKATNLPVMAYSRAGYGQSDGTDLPRPLDYMTREALDVLPEVLNAMNIRRAILIGHSDGATIAAINAGLSGDTRVCAIALMAPHFFTEDMGLRAIASAKAAFDTGTLRDRLAKYHRDPDMAFRGWNDAWLDPGFRDWDVRHVLDTIQVPVLTLQGRDDPYGTLAQTAVVVERCPAPVQDLTLDDCRHAPFLEHPDAVLAALSAFCVAQDA